VIDVPALASAEMKPPAASDCPIADPTLNDSPAAIVRADKIMLEAVAEPPDGTRCIVAVIAPAVVFVSVQAAIVVIVFAGVV
jgi:hypothetical protein